MTGKALINLLKQVKSQVDESFALGLALSGTKIECLVPPPGLSYAFNSNFIFSPGDKSWN
ncbi:hypothetical protein THICB2_700047 [Thiomonas sp. CB2]|nr:hypothetical protein THICB2_700047 [Thiomonas sp. CB2]CQR44377.1 hypothetical protein THICB3510034 [Thiomonas sp. CB3]VDY03314.1 protein of unknown function [Thiomonas sp. Bio17B3]VDY09512.1 protein of unknown function [Thiomonas sp. Sup16B3]VDY11563.1 conserved protein of unknown function [Thiomonas sp. OC7]